MRLTQEEHHRYTMAHFQDRSFLSVEANRRHKIDAKVQRVVLIGAEGKMKNLCAGLVTICGAKEFDVTPAGSSTAPTDTDSREDCSWIAAEVHR